jgi:hypothetical protein
VLLIANQWKEAELEKIYAVDRALDKLLAGFEELASMIPFKLVGSLLDDELVSRQSYPGIYFIEVYTRGTALETLEQWIDTFRGEWQAEKYRDRFVANPQKRRIRTHLASGELKEWMPVYIGKSQHVNCRLREHVHLPLEKKTFALKLAARPTMMARQWRFSTISLDGISNYGVIAPQMESALRNHYHPIVGKQ